MTQLLKEWVDCALEVDFRITVMIEFLVRVSVRLRVRVSVSVIVNVRVRDTGKVIVTIS